ncbi:bacterial regulatory s, tetR family protein [Mycobacterium kansasii 662]|uniref:Bacterial regulatory s, tetR family protein n=2 Tax=Mycobacterium TaxID=1763 RepID=X7YR38_MYCKA|nr:MULTISPECIES: TetR/AcrR family transcriptional regulator [Mycobacterium]EUA09687.1 bacterial regulatory s, tetR family protein [Mycobacterium kansasii 662]UCA23001.1 TetR/AcrR family transcriptional regulator; helix-turn-helix transcriptional regulator [Mycobacterium kansasii]VBA68765.1 putative HTH-type transcriptional regulator [Mycobacterium pseudokansasii]
MTSEFSVEDGYDIDPRRLRSRTRLLDAATHLLSAGGIEAVTIDAVTKASKVARTTLYRHFSSSAQLLAATFERLLPHVTPPPLTGSLRDRLVELLSRQAALIEETPIHLTTLAWLALGPPPSEGDVEDAHDRQQSLSSLKVRVIDQYREPFDQILGTPDARAELGDFELTLALTQLIGPIVFARLTGLHTIDHQDCARIVDDFLAAHRREITTTPAEPTNPEGSATTVASA